MRKAVKISLITATCLVIAGIIMFVGALAAAGFDLQNFSTIDFVTDTVAVSGDFDSISIDVTSADIDFKPAKDKQCKVVFFDREGVEHSAAVSGKTLTVKTDDSKKWTDIFNISFEKPTVTVYLPKNRFDELTVKTTTGDVNIPHGLQFDRLSVDGTTGDVTCSADVKEQLRIDMVTGDVRLKNTHAGSVKINVVTGDVTLDSVDAEKTISAESTTGDVKFVRSDAPDITVTTTTGDVTGSLLTGKVFAANTTTGDISIPSTTAGGKCEITTTTGDIRIEIDK